MRRSQRMLRLARLREAEVMRSQAALAEALRREAEAAARLKGATAALGRDRLDLHEREQAGCTAHELSVHARRMPVLEARCDQAMAELSRCEPETAARRATLAEARTRQESLERYAERLGVEEKQVLARKDQLQTDELGARAFVRPVRA